KDKTPPQYIRKQTTVNAERYITPELKEYEEQVVTADERAKQLEYELFIALRDPLQKEPRRLHATPAVLPHLATLTRLSPPPHLSIDLVGARDNMSTSHTPAMLDTTAQTRTLNTATPRSLVILDEIGRGTSTSDGISLAWAIVEHLHDQVGCRTLFDTHYHD